MVGEKEQGRGRSQPECFAVTEERQDKSLKSKAGGDEKVTQKAGSRISEERKKKVPERMEVRTLESFSQKKRQ